jgi:two-component sensor histidine kinase
MTNGSSAFPPLDETTAGIAFDLAGIGLWAFDPAAGEVILTQTAARMYGLAALTPLSLLLWRQGVSDGDRPRVTAALQAMADSAADGLRYTLTGPDGQDRELLERWRVTRPSGGRSPTLLGVVTDVSGEAAQESRRRELIHELQHRMKNILSVVRSMARRTAAHSSSIEEFSAHFEGRLAALAQVQTTLARTRDGRADLEDLVRQELVHSLGTDDGVEIAGPPIALRGRRVELLALALHELAANAVKFGSLSRGGRLSITWEDRPATADRARSLLISWLEQSDTPALPAASQGFGHELVQRGLPYELDARVEIDFLTSGLRCTIDLPLDAGDR